MDGWFWVRIGAVVGFLTVGMGAFGAHSLSDRLKTLGTLANFETAAQYQMYHALGLVAVGLLCLAGRSDRALSVAGWGFLVGTIVFSGSLYILSLTGNKRLGAITPIGGVALLIGWLALAIATARSSRP